MNFIKGLESLLEQVDQTAQKLAHKEGEEDGSSSPVGSVRNATDGAAGAGRAPGTSASGRIQAQSRPATKPKSDDEIFAFLNTPVAGGGAASLPSSPVRPATASVSASSGSRTKPASSSASSTRARPLAGGRGKPASKPTTVARKLSVSGSASATAGTAKVSDLPVTAPSAESASEGGKQSPPKRRQGGSGEHQLVKEKDASSPSVARNQKPVEAQPTDGAVVDTTAADTEKESSEEEHKPSTIADGTESADGDEAKPQGDSGDKDGERENPSEKINSVGDGEEKEKSHDGDQEADGRQAHTSAEHGQEEESHRTDNGEGEGDATASGEANDTSTVEEDGGDDGEDSGESDEREERQDDEERRLAVEDGGKEVENDRGENDDEEEYDQGGIRVKHLEEQVDTLLNEGTKLKMENKLMRSEVRALNDEVTSLTERITSEHEALERANDALHALQMEVLDKDRQLMRLRKQEDEFDAVLAKKDAQQAALQVKLEEANLHVVGLEQTMNALKQELDRLHREKDETNELSKQSITLINTKIAELEQQLKEERESASSQRSLALERERNLESDISEYTKALGQAQRAIEDKNKQVEKHMASIKELEANVQGLKQELADYKLRAKKVLQQREATIHELTEKLSSPGAANGEGGELQEKWKELMLQKQEYESLKNEFDETKDELNKIKQNLAQTQEQAEHDALEFEEQVKALEDELERERERVRKMQFELAQRMQELHTVKDQQNQAANGLKEQIKERDAQIAKLKRQITVKGIQAQSSSQAELESSLSAMTDRLIRLQALNETLTNEKAALQMRLNSEIQGRREREGIRRSNEVDTRHSSGDITSIIINTGAEPRDKSGPRLRSIASLVPESWSGDPESKRHQVYTHTLRAASALDTFTAQVGRILRRNPLARLLLLLYMVFLHVWVLFLLSRPLEIHDMMDESLPPGAVPPTGLPDSLIHAESAQAAAGAVGM